MKSRVKRGFRWLFKKAKMPLLMGIGLFIGLAIGADNNGGSTVIVRTDGRAADELAHNFEQRIEHQIQERIVEEINIPPIPEIPAIPEIPEIPAIPEIPSVPELRTNIHIVESTPSFWDVLNGIGTILASLMLIVLGGKILLRRRQVPKEKTPESVGA